MSSLKEEILYIQGSAKGYFLKGNSITTGNLSISDIQFETIDVRDTVVIDEIDLNEHCVGLYYKSARSKEIRVFISETEFIQEKVSEFVIRDIIKGEKNTCNGTELQEFNGTIIFKLKKVILPAPAVVIDKPLKPSGLSGFFNFNLFKSNSTLITPTSQVLSKTKQFWQPIIGGLIIGLFSIYVLSQIHGLGILSLVLPAIFFSIILSQALSERFSWFKSNWSIKNYLLNFIAYLFLIYALDGLFKHGFTANTTYFLVLAIGLILFSRIGKFIKLIGICLLLLSFYLLFNMINLDSQIKKTKDDTPEYVDQDDTDWEYIPEIDSSTIRTETDDTVPISFLKHQLNWNDNSNNFHSGIFKVRSDFYNISRLKRDKLEVNANDARTYYNIIYRNLINQNNDYLTEIIKEYKKIGRAKNMNKSDFADMVVSSIQSIPYYLVHDLSHREADRVYGGFISEYHRTGGPCLDKIKFGVQSPTEFMGNFKGDCDTRSVLLYHVLSKLGYNVVVLASDEYSHAIIGVFGNYRGDYLKYQGLKYYVWETTAKGFTPGSISDECSNMRYWYVAMGPNTNL
jgi:hypothetical protein